MKPDSWWGKEKKIPLQQASGVEGKLVTSMISLFQAARYT